MKLAILPGFDLFVPQGKLVGGTSWVTRFAVRAAPADFAAWTRRGCAGWGFDEVLPWFRRVETDQDFPDAPWHGGDGPMPVTRYRDVPDSAFAAAAKAACESAGIAVVDDLNRPDAVGVGRMPMTSHDGLRVTTADAYLPIEGRPAGLTVLANTLVSAVVVRAGAAEAVRLSDGRVLGAALVVLCAGVYGSPAVLMRSGIGPAAHVAQLGLPVVADLPGVGSNLADHPQVWLDPGYGRPGQERPPLHLLATFRSSFCEAGQSPDLALWIADPSGDPVEAAIEVLLMTPASRGSVRLASADPTAAALIRLPQLDSGSDYERLAEGLMRAREVAQQPELREMCDRPPTDLSTSERVRAWIGQERYSIPHTIGTCAMGDRPESGCVVDARGNVHGVDRLAVIDASIIPLPPSGFPHIVTIMIAERLSSHLAHTTT